MLRMIVACFFFCSLTQMYGQDIVLIKDNGSAMEGYLQEVSKDSVSVKFGTYTIDMGRKSVDIIFGEPYEELKSEDLLSPLHELNARDKIIKKAIRKSKKILRKWKKQGD